MSKQKKTRTLITGTEGYIGIRLAGWLSRSGHEVTGLDTGFYREGTLYHDPLQLPQSPPTRFQDLRNLTAADLVGFDAVVHLAELSNDPLGEHCPETTFSINHRGSVSLAEAARKPGVTRFVYASSCSVYGATAEDIVNETSPVNPQTAYAECKVRVERDLSAMSSTDFGVTFLRNATAYGASPRMRFDIVLNDLCALAWTRRKIEMISDGSPWRPLVHIEDVCEAIRCALEAPMHRVNDQIFNVGTTTENYRIRDIAALVANAFPGCELITGPPSGDNRSYQVDFSKIENDLPGYRSRWCAADGAMELRQLFERINMSADTYSFRAFTRLSQLRYLQDSRQLDEDLYWTAP